MSMIERLKAIELMAQNQIENAQRLLEDAAALREELSGGSDSSYKKNVLSPIQRDLLIQRRRRNMFKR